MRRQPPTSRKGQCEPQSPVVYVDTGEKSLISTWGRFVTCLLNVFGRFVTCLLNVFGRFVTCLLNVFGRLQTCPRLSSHGRAKRSTFTTNMIYGWEAGTAIISIVKPKPATPTDSTTAFDAAGGRCGL